MQKPEYPLLTEAMVIPLDAKVHGPLKRIREQLCKLIDDINLLDSVDGVEQFIDMAYHNVDKTWRACLRAARRAEQGPTEIVETLHLNDTFEAILNPAEDPADPNNSPFMQELNKGKKPRKPKA